MFELTAAHWAYLIGIVVILATMIIRRSIVVPAVLFTFLTALLYSGDLVTAIAAIFNASLVSAQELFSIFLIIALVTAMLNSLRVLHADRLMVAPFRPLMRNGHLAFWTLAAVTYMISLFFWPTPAVPLIGAVLIPVAIRAGLRPMAVAFTIAVAGQGMALSSDFVIRVAPGLSAAAAGVDPTAVANQAFVLSLITGGCALVIGYVLELRRMKKPSDALLQEWENISTDNAAVVATAPTSGHGAAIEREPALVGPGERGAGPAAGGSDAPLIPASGSTPASGSSPASGSTGDVMADAALNRTDDPVDEKPSRVAIAFAILVPTAYLALIIFLVWDLAAPGDDGLRGGEAAALVGGIAALIIMLASLAENPRTCLQRSADHVVDGLVFAFKAMGVVLPIAGFFFIGNPDYSARILGVSGEGDAEPVGPAFLLDLVMSAQAAIPQSAMLTAFVVLAVGLIAGLEGSGFSGLPLTGSLAGTLGPVTGVDPVTLAAIGQMGNIWSGGGTLVAWSSLIAVAGFARVSVIDLARMCFIPVMAGLILSTVAAVLIFA